MSRNLFTACRLSLFAWLCALSLLLLPLLFTGMPTEKFMVHVTLLDAIDMKPTSQALRFERTAGFVKTRIVVAAALVVAALVLEVLWHRRRRVGRHAEAFYVLASCALLAYLTFGLWAILSVLVVL